MEVLRSWRHPDGGGSELRLVSTQGAARYRSEEQEACH